MLVERRLVVKLPHDRVQELIADGNGMPFAMGHGRVMREWVAIPASDPVQWIRLAEEARGFVARQR
jgi:hypothetical protein